MLEIAVTNTDRLVRLINDILDLERIDSGQIELTRAATDAFELMTEVAEGVQSFAAEGGVQIDVTEIEAVLDVDPDRITQTLTNLLGNAIKFSPRGTTVSLAGSIAGGMFSFRIADEGRGVPLDKLETIFERFQQVDASDSRDKGGSGLGLAICRSIVNAHGGSIWAEPNSPCGTVFRFTVPLRQAEASFTVSGGDGKPRVLIVEDDADLARVLTTSLQRQGIPTQHVSTGQAAIDVCRRARPALLVLDLALPDIDGFAVVDTLRREPGLLDVPVVVYSVTEVGAADRARLRLGPTSFLTKSRDALAVFESQVMLLLGMKNRGENEDAA
jgi:CheY-like chemotaxis protein